MFPLNSNDQYIDSNGKRSKLGDAIGSGGGSELPEHSSADAGKVLKVADDGSLEWDEDGGAGGVYVGTTDPDPLIGENGNYYYKRSNFENWLRSGIFTQYSSQKYYGNEFVAKTPCKITSIGGMLHKTMTGALRIGNLTGILATIDNISFTADAWTFVDLETPIVLNTDDHFIIGFDATGSSHIPYGEDAASYSGNTDIAEYVTAHYGTHYPGTADNGTRVAVSFKVEDVYYVVTDQYIKKSGIWTKIG